MQEFISAEWPTRRKPAKVGSMPKAARSSSDPASLAEIQKRLRITQEALSPESAAKLCRQIGISTQQWSNYLNDERISIDSAIKLCRATGLTLDWIYLGNRTLLPAVVLDALMKAESQPPKVRKRA